jgi:hypothetical protein
MDPVSIGVAAAALLGSKAVDEFATHAGSTAWRAVHRMGASVRSRLSPRGAQALDQLTATAVADADAAGGAAYRAGVRSAVGAGVGAGAGAGDEARAVVAGEIEVAVRADPGFRAELEALVAEAGRSEQLATVMAVARDNAKQVNIGGDNSGSISF